MRVLYDDTIFNQKYGGISRVFYEIISRLTGYNDVDVELFMGFFVNQYGLECFRDSCRNFEGCKIPNIRYTGFLRRFMNNVWWQNFKERAEHTDIYHPTYYNYRDIDATRVKKIFTVHDFTHEKLKELFRNDKTSAIKKKAFAAADGLICISENTKKDMCELYDVSPSCKTKVIYHGYSDLSVLLGSTNDVSVHNKPYILFVGPRYHYKNFTVLAEAFGSNTHLKNNFDLVCFGGAIFSSDELQLFGKLGISQKVHRYIGNDHYLANFYKNAASFIYPSLYEGFGLPLLEAMSCSCPVIASNTSSIPEIAGDAAILFDPRSTEMLASSMYALLSDNALREKMIKRGLERCKLFSWDRCAEETASFYREIMD